MNNPETYVLTHNRFNTYIFLIFTDLKRAQIYKMLYRNSPHKEIEKVMSFDYLHVFGLDENNKDGNFLFEIGDKKYIHMGEKIFNFETNDDIVDYFSEHGFNDVKYTYAYDKQNIYFMLYQKYIPIQEYENSTAKNEYQYLYKKNDENNNDPERIDIVCGEDFLNCKFIHSKH